MGIFDNFIYKDGESIDNSWVKWFHWGVPDEEGREREKTRNRLEGLGHCKPCTVLSGCYFVKSRRYIFSNEEKYLLNGKRELFESLGFLKEDSEYLKMEFDVQAKQKYLNGDYEIGKLDEHGQRINITITVDSATRKNIKLVTGWMVYPLGKIVCTTPLGG